MGKVNIYRNQILLMLVLRILMLMIIKIIMLKVNLKLKDLKDLHLLEVLILVFNNRFPCNMIELNKRRSNTSF